MRGRGREKRERERGANKLPEREREKGQQREYSLEVVIKLVSRRKWEITVSIV